MRANGNAEIAPFVSHAGKLSDLALNTVPTGGSQPKLEKNERRLGHFAACTGNAENPSGETPNLHSWESAACPLCGQLSQNHGLFYAFGVSVVSNTAPPLFPGT